MCQIAKKMKMKLKILVGILVNIPFFYCAAFVRSGVTGQPTTGWWIPILVGIGMAICFTSGSLWKTQ